MHLQFRWLITISGLLLLLVAGIFVWQLTSAHTFSGVVNSPAQPAPDLTLTDDRGNAFELSELRGRWVLLAYGYTHCPDVCPLTLGNLRSAKQLMGAASGKVAVVFVTVDPERDTVSALHDYLSHFGPDFVGLTGSPAEIAVAAKAYNVRYSKVETGSSSGYAMAHSAYVYLIDPQGQWRLTYAFGVKPEEFAADLNYLAREP